MRALFAKIREILRDRHLRRIWTRVISVMASVVVFISTYALILPAITMESKAACGIEAHQHTDECYEDVLTCGREESEDHQHTDACYTRTLICGKEAHIHSAECYKEDSSAVAVSGGTAVPAVTDGSAGDSSSDQSSGNHQTGQTSQPTQVDVSDASGPAADADGQGAGAEMSGTPENAGTTVTAEGLPADANTLSDGTGYVPVLDILNFDSLLTRETGFYYFHAEEGQPVPENSSAITDWKKLKNNTTLASTDLVKAYLAYSIPAGALNETNQTARYRLPANLHLTDDQIQAINRTENGVAGAFAAAENGSGNDSGNGNSESAADGSENTDSGITGAGEADAAAGYEKYFGAEAVEGTRTPDKTLREGAQEYISATVRAENVYEGMLDENGNYIDFAGTQASPASDRKDLGDYIGQDLIFTFTPYTVQKNQNTYDMEGNPLTAGEKVTGWFAVDFNMDQIDWVEEDTDLDKSTVEKSAEILFAVEDDSAGSKERKTVLRLEEQAPAGENGTEDTADQDKDAEDAEKAADHTDGTLTADGDGYSITLDYTADAQIPENASLSVKEITPDTDPEAYEACLQQAAQKMGASIPESGNAGTNADANTGAAGDAADAAKDGAPALDTAASRFFDIEIVVTNDDGKTEKIEPKAPVAVNIQLSSAPQAAKQDKADNAVAKSAESGKSGEETSVDSAQKADPTVLHFAEEGVEEMDATVAAPVDGNTANGKKDETGSGDTKQAENAAGTMEISFEAESFSIYGVVYTVDFEYSVNGKMYQFSLPGGEKITLSDLVEVLGIIGDTNSGEKAAFNSVEDFLKEVANVQFSDESLVKVVKNEEGNDWTLESLQPFDTEESLTITMKNGDVVTVKVTDSQAGGDLAAFVTDATLVIDGKTYGAGTTWNVRPNVDYKLTLNFLEKGSRQLPGGGEEMTLAMPSGMSLEPGMSGSFDIPCGLAGTLAGNTWWVDDSGNLHIRFADDPDDLLTRSSNIHFDLTIDAKFDGSENHFEFNNNVKRDAEFNNDTDVDVQKSGSYNASTGKMEYTVTVKSTGKSKNVTVSDAISGNMLTLDENSFEITPSSKTPSSTSTNSKGFAMTFGEMAHNETVTIKYTASVDTSKIGPGGKVTGDDGKNSVTVTNDDHKTDTDENITNTIKFSDIAKSSTSSVETADGEKVEMEWKITANEGQLGSIKGSKITDTIDHGSKDIMHYVVGNDGKLALSVKKIAPNGTSTTETVYVDVSKTYDQGPETWTWIPQDEGNYAYEITYKTLVTKQTENTTVKNNTSNESGGSTSGTGVVPGTNPGGGGGGGTDVVVGGKAAVAVTPEYIDWDIVVAVQSGDDFTGRFEIVDEIPNGAGLGRKFADTFDSILSVTGLNEHEDYTYEVTKEQHDTLSPKEKDILKITFWQDKAHTDPGIDKGARTITVRIRTKNDPDWVKFADTAAGGEQAIYHTNSAKVNDSEPFTDRAAPMHTQIDKEKEQNLTFVVDGEQLPGYEYSVTLSNVTELPVVITDTYDPDELVFVGEGRANGWNGHHGIAAATQKNNLNNPDSNYHATFSADNETGTLTITANSLPTKPDGSYYEFYRIYYTMRVKDADALDSFAQQAIANGGTYLIGNTAEWNGDDDHVDVEYKVPGLSKEGYFSSSSNNRLYTFILDVNRNGLEMNGGENMDLLDSHTKNLSVDYSTVKVYKITDGQSYDDAKQYQLNESMLTNEVTWNFDANEGTFSIPDRTHYVITYDALVIGSGNQSFKNEAELKGYRASKEDSKEYGSDSHAGGTINQINLLKYEAGQTSKGLQGAVFQLLKGTGEYDPVTGDEIKEELKYGKSGTRPDGTTFAAGDNITFTTGADGTVLIALDQSRHGEQLDTGVHYYLKEIDSPPGYQIDSSVEYWEFTLTDDPDEVNYGDPERRDENGRRQWIYFSYGDILKMANKSTVEPLNVVVNKQWFDKDGNEITGENLNQDYKATIQLMRKTDSGDYVKVKVTGSGSNLTVTEVSDNSGEIELNSDNNWAYTWSQLPRVAYGGKGGMEIIAHYAYKVEEVSVEGYVSSVSETENETTKTYALKNYKVPEDRNTEITVNKVWQDEEGNVIPGTTEKLPDNIAFSIYQVTSKTPFTRVPSSGGNKYIISGDSHLLEGGADDTNDNYGLYQIQRDENWTATFRNLPSVVTANGETTYYAYYVKEEALTGYKTTYTSDGTTRTIVNREPLDEDSNYIDIGLEKKWTDGTNTTPPSGASATFTVHQQKSTVSGTQGTVLVRVVNDDLTTVVSSLMASAGDQLRLDFTSKNSWDNSNVSVKNSSGGWTYKANVSAGNYTYTVATEDIIDGSITFKFDSTGFVDGCSVKPFFTNTTTAAPTYSEYEDTTWTKSVTLPTTAGAWSTTIKDLIQEDADGNLYRYYITEDSSFPAVTSVTFKDKDGNDIKDSTAAESVNQTTATLNTSGQKVEVTNTYENVMGAVKVTKSFSGVDSLPTGFRIANDYNGTVFTVGSTGMTGTGTADDPYVWILDNVPVGTEVTFTESGATVDGATLTITANGTAVAEGSTTATANATSAKVETGGECPTATFVNEYEQTTDFEFSKIWKDIGNQPTAWPTGATITVTLNAYTDDISKKEIDDVTVELSANGSAAGVTPAWTATTSSDGKKTTFKVEGLAKYSSDGKELTYYVTETQVDGYKAPAYATSEGSGLVFTGSDDVPKAINRQQIINTPEGGYELPSTGGPGTRLFTILGSILILGAGVLLWRRRRLI